jgi:dephospho-CoA kinase
MLTVALTGNIAAGKSRVAQLFRRWGASVADADQLVRAVQAPGTPEFAAIVARFGPQVVAPDGTLDRARLRALVFDDPEARRALEAILHPAVHRQRLAIVAAARTRGERLVVCEIPLLFEAMDPGTFDAVVLVDAPAPVRLARLVAERGLTEAEARRMMAAQMPADAKRAWRGGPTGRGPYIIENDADVATLERRARVVWEELLASGDEVTRRPGHDGVTG